MLGLKLNHVSKRGHWTQNIDASLFTTLEPSPPDFDIKGL